MQLKRLLMALLLSTFLTTTFGQTPNAESPIPVIEVVGTAQQEVVPDEINIAITLRERQNGKEKITIEQQEEALKNGLTSIGITLDNLFLSNANTDVVTVKRSKRNLITKANYLLKVGDAATVGKVFDKLEDLQISNARISSVYHSKLPELKREVRIMAIKAAKEKSDYLLQAIDQETGKALLVEERQQKSYDSNSNLNIRGSRNDANYYFIDGVKVPFKNEAIQFQKIKLQSTMYVKFEIK